MVRDELNNIGAKSFLMLHQNSYWHTVFPNVVAAATILFLEVGVRQLFKGGNYSKEETIDFFFSVILLSLE